MIFVFFARHVGLYARSTLDCYDKDAQAVLNLFNRTVLTAELALT
jgi:hypothetical protein